MEIYTSYFAKLNRLEKLGYFPVSIARFKPKGVDIPEILEFAPSKEILFKIKNGEIDEDGYTSLYREQMSSFDFEEILEALKRLSESVRKPLVLLCYEKSGEFCHRHIFSSLMAEKTGYIIKELNV